MEILALHKSLSSAAAHVGAGVSPARPSGARRFVLRAWVGQEKRVPPLRSLRYGPVGMTGFWGSPGKDCVGTATLGCPAVRSAAAPLPAEARASLARPDSRRRLSPREPCQTQAVPARLLKLTQPNASRRAAPHGATAGGPGNPPSEPGS